MQIVTLQLSTFCKSWTDSGATRSVLRIRRPFFTCFSSFLSNCRLAAFHSEVKNRRYCVSFEYKSTRLKSGTQRTPYRNILFEAVFGKVFRTNARMLRGRKRFSFHFYKPFSFKFLIPGELKSANFCFRVVSAVYCCTKHHGFLWSSMWTSNHNSFQIFPHFFQLANSDVTSFISDNFPKISPTALRLWRLKKSDFHIPISPQCFVEFVWNFKICLFYT